MATQVAAPKYLINAAGMAATVTSPGFRISNLDNISIQVTTVNSDGVGAWTVQGSNVEVGSAKAPSTAAGDWVTLTQGITNPPNSASANESFLYELNQIGCTFIRLVWTRTSGTVASTITAIISGKGF